MRKDQIPNILTAGRLILLPVLIAMFFFDGAWAAWTALVIYIAGCLTDFLDGWLARKWNVISDFGRFLDPIADKMFVNTVLFLLVAFDRLEGLWIIPAILILLREILISGLREFLGPKNITVPVTELAKWKTTVQMVALGFLVVGSHGTVLFPYVVETGQIGILFAAGLTLMTGWVYLKASWKHISG